MSFDSAPIDSPYARIYAWARLIPRGRLVTYGQLAALAGLPGAARMVGYAMRAARDDDDIPWQRVINAAGQISPRADPFGESLQRQLLEEEGVVFDALGRTDLKALRWLPEELLTASLEEMPAASKKPAPKNKTAKKPASPPRARPEKAAAKARQAARAKAKKKPR